MTQERFSEKEIREQLPQDVPPPWLSLYKKANPHISAMMKTPIEGFEKRRKEEARKLIEAENERRLKEGKEPITFVGIHASKREDAVSGEILDRITEGALDVGINRNIVEISNESGKVDAEALNRAVEQIRSADGFIITTHTKRGAFNSFYTALAEALENENLTGKLVGFAHTYDSATEDSQIAPGMQAQQFFQSKGCIIIPSSFMYAHTGEKNEEWLERDMAGNGVRFANALDRLTRSNLVNMLEDPEKLRDRKKNGEINPEWQRLRDRVNMVNQEREKNGEEPLNVLFVLGGEAPAEVEKEDSETGETKKMPGGKSARISRVLAKNFEFLGLKTDTIHLASEEHGIEYTSGDPNLRVVDVIEGKEEDPHDALMQEAYKKLLRADIVIFTTPVRWFNVSAHLQKFIERTTPFEGLLEGKAFGTVVTFGEAGASEVQAKLDHWAHHNGLMTIPLGGLKHHLSWDLEAGGRPSPVFKAREMAGLGTGLVVDFLAADGNKVKNLDFKGVVHPIMEIVEPGD